MNQSTVHLQIIWREKEDKTQFISLYTNMIEIAMYLNSWQTYSLQFIIIQCTSWALVCILQSAVGESLTSNALLLAYLFSLRIMLFHLRDEVFVSFQI